MIDHILKNNFVVTKDGNNYQLDNFFYLRKLEKGQIVRKPATALIYDNPYTGRLCANIHLLEWSNGKVGNVPKVCVSNAICRFKEQALGTLDPMEISQRLPSLFAELRMEGFASRNI